MDTWTTLTLHRQMVCELQRDAARRRLTKIALAHARSSRSPRRRS
jgi:hypothetical protein